MSPPKGVRSRGQKDAARPLATVLLALLNVVRNDYVLLGLRNGQVMFRMSPRKGVRSRGQKDAARPLIAVLLTLLKMVHTGLRNG